MNFRPHHVLAASLVLASLPVGEAAAAIVTGEQLLYLCTSNMGGRGNPLASAECMGFVVGVADTFEVNAAFASPLRRVRQSSQTGRRGFLPEMHPAQRGFVLLIRQSR